GTSASAAPAACTTSASDATTPANPSSRSPTRPPSQSSTSTPARSSASTASTPPEATGATNSNHPDDGPRNDRCLATYETYVARHHMVPLEGLEPPTLSLGRNCSSIELQRLTARVYRAEAEEQR